MEIDWGAAIVGLIMILICIVPFVIMYYNRKKKENKMLQSLNEIAKPHNCKINQHEFCGDYVMGIDESRNFVFFFKQKKEEAVSQFVDLAEIQSCQVVKKAISTYSIQKLELAFLPTNKSKTETKFELYDEEINTQLSGELQFIDKWAKQINDRLKNK